ncbi:hypothetical protein Lal_00032255 [Lupinus albus]|nr:hypothetical protein Lal_00032255 [Lupinus albus]
MAKVTFPGRCHLFSSPLTMVGDGLENSRVARIRMHNSELVDPTSCLDKIECSHYSGVNKSRHAEMGVNSRSSENLSAFLSLKRANFRLGESPREILGEALSLKRETSNNPQTS